jgi:hypothetical protein
MTYQEAVEEQIDDIMDDFDFDKVHKIMEFLNWEWWFEENEKRVPEVSELRKKAREYLRYVAKHGGTTGSGGFTAQCKKVYSEEENKSFVWLTLYWGLNSMNDGICHN